MVISIKNDGVQENVWRSKLKQVSFNFFCQVNKVWKEEWKYWPHFLLLLSHSLSPSQVSLSSLRKNRGGSEHHEVWFFLSPVRRTVGSWKNISLLPSFILFFSSLSILILFLFLLHVCPGDGDRVEASGSQILVLSLPHSLFSFFFLVLVVLDSVTEAVCMYFVTIWKLEPASRSVFGSSRFRFSPTQTTFWTKTDQFNWSKIMSFLALDSCSWQVRNIQLSPRLFIFFPLPFNFDLKPEGLKKQTRQTDRYTFFSLPFPTFFFLSERDSPSFWISSFPSLRERFFFPLSSPFWCHDHFLSATCESVVRMKPQLDQTSSSLD